MIKKVFSVYDSKAQMYIAPIFLLQPGEAIRMFEDAVNDSQILLSKHPGDYVLYQLGTFDDESGQFENTSPAVHLGIGSDYVKRSPRVSLPSAVPAEVTNGRE